MNYYLLIPIILMAIGLAASLYVLLKNNIVPNNPGDQPTPTRQIPEVDEAFDVPEEDQEYLAPLIVKTLKHLAATKRAYPTNAQLINHLAEALSDASGSFERRTKDNPFLQRGNEAWLYVAALSIRLFDEGTPHNADNTREQWVTTGVLAGRELDQWAKQITQQVTDIVQSETGESTGTPVQQHAQTVAGTPYTPDEVEDMKKGHELRLIRKANKNKS